MTTEALLSILFSLIFSVAPIYFLAKVREVHNYLYGVVVCMFSLVFLLAISYGLSVEHYGYRQVTYTNTTSNETITVEEPLYRSNPYVVFLLIPIILNLVVLILYAFLWLTINYVPVISIRKK